LYDFDRDERWAVAISERTANLRDGWIAAVVGWVHADPQGDPRRLRGLLSSRGIDIDSVCLAPSVESAPRGNSVTS
jgi:hypothetical protein